MRPEASNSTRGAGELPRDHMPQTLRGHLRRIEARGGLAMAILTSLPVPPSARARWPMDSPQEPGRLADAIWGVRRRGTLRRGQNPGKGFYRFLGGRQKPPETTEPRAPPKLGGDVLLDRRGRFRLRGAARLDQAVEGRRKAKPLRGERHGRSVSRIQRRRFEPPNRANAQLN